MYEKIIDQINLIVGNILFRINLCNQKNISYFILIMAQNLISRIGQFRNYQIVTAFYLSNLIISVIFSYVLFSGASTGFKFASILEELLLAVILVPVIETYVLQHLVIKFLQSKLVSVGLILLVCGLVFGLMHVYNVGYFLKACISGMIYGLLYLSMEHKNSNPILFVSICHSMYNLTGFIINNFF